MNKLIEAAEIDPTDITIPTTKAKKAVSRHLQDDCRQKNITIKYNCNFRILSMWSIKRSKIYR